MSQCGCGGEEGRGGRCEGGRWVWRGKKRGEVSVEGEEEEGGECGGRKRGKVGVEGKRERWVWRGRKKEKKGVEGKRERWVWGGGECGGGGRGGR